MSHVIPIPTRPRATDDAEYWLNEGQTLLITMVADTSKAALARRELVQIFMTWRRGQLLPKSAAPILMDIIGEFEAK
jgi:hypothetical protein